MIWWTRSWNPIVGCEKCSPACANCYAERLHTQRHKAKLAGQAGIPDCYAQPFNTVRFLPERLAQLQVGGDPQIVFACNMSDMFHKDVREEWLRSIFWAFASRPRHTFCVLTKRWERMLDFITSHRLDDYPLLDWPLPNVLHGATVWDQPSMDAAARLLLKMPEGARLFLSIEPMLGPVVIPAELLARLAWVICGGENGPKARPMHPDWPRRLRDDCVAAGVPFFFKQWGEWASDLWDDTRLCVVRSPDGSRWERFDESMQTAEYAGAEIMVPVGSRRAGRKLDGRTWEEVPA